MSRTDPSTDQETEGTIRFAYGLEHPDGPVADPEQFLALRGWRTVLRRLGLLGQDAGRYGGLGFGNLSARDPQQPEQFVITASQTAGTPAFEDADLVRIVAGNTARFWVDALGHQPPSSETLTHAMVYQADASVGWVLHGHSPDIWQRAEELALPATAADVPYGSPAMVDAVAGLLAAHPGRPLVFVTLGHRDGVFGCGPSAAATGGALVAALARSLA
ncbi:MAG: class II aldolase/adducin family protein [Pseudomonadales bacterium]